MSETIREKMQEIISDTKYGELTVNQCADQILALFPQWRTFSETCKPEEGSKFVVRNWNVAEMIGDHMWVGNYIKECYQWYPIP